MADLIVNFLLFDCQVQRRMQSKNKKIDARSNCPFSLFLDPAFYHTVGYGLKLILPII